MKKSYQKPSVEEVKFQYSDQVVAASGLICTIYKQVEGTSCISDDAVLTREG